MSTELTPQTLARANTLLPIAAKGEIALPIKASGGKRRTLFDTGKVTLNISLTYQPNGGTQGNLATKVKLRKKL